jgi:hypothetical protein
MHNDTEKAIDEALEGKPRAADLAEMISALGVRRETFEREKAGAHSEEERKGWSQRIKELDRQVLLLKEEMAITDFVERSVRSAATRPRLDTDDEDDY